MDHTDLVRQIKASLEARGVSLSGPCGAFAITKRVAWALRREGAGLLDKPSGNNCLGYATDIIVYPSGQHYDILIGSGSENGPAWQDAGLVDPGRWRSAVDPGDAVDPTPPPEVPPPDAIAAIHATALQVDQMRGIIVEIAATLHTLRAEAQTVSRQAGAALTRLEQTLGRIEQQTRRIR